MSVRPSRFWDHIEIHVDGCWLWTGALNGTGYAKFSGGAGRRGWRFAHRVVYEALIGPIPEGLTLDHLCRVRHCVNPEHLEPVTCRVNVLRGATVAARAAAATHCAKGHPYDEANTCRLKTGPKVGTRQCRACNRLRSAKRRAAKRQQAA